MYTICFHRKEIGFKSGEINCTPFAFGWAPAAAHTKERTGRLLPPLTPTRRTGQICQGIGESGYLRRIGKGVEEERSGWIHRGSGRSIRERRI